MSPPWFCVLVPMALAMANLPDGALKNALYEWHKSFGLTVLALARPGSWYAPPVAPRPSSRPARPGSDGRPGPPTLRSMP